MIAEWYIFHRIIGLAQIVGLAHELFDCNKITVVPRKRTTAERKKKFLSQKKPKNYISLKILEPGKIPKHQHAQQQKPKPTD